jgi:hypothetical protein
MSRSSRPVNRPAIVRSVCAAALAAGVLLPGSAAWAATVTENFNVDPGWDGHNNRVTNPRSITESFGFSNTSNAGGPAGEVGGLITPVGETAYYAKSITARDLTQTLSASGKLKLTGGGNTLLGFFNDSTVNEWRTANSVGLRLYGRSSYFLAYPEYGTSKWRAGAGSFPGSGGNEYQAPVNTVMNWTLNYDPSGNGGNGTIVTTLRKASGGPTKTATVNLDAGHKADTALFNRFGLLNVVKSADDPGNLWIDSITVNGVTDNFGSNPNWNSLNNNSTYSSNNVRFNFDFGYSPTNHAGGAGSGEMGGHFFRGDSREAGKMAFYGDELAGPLSFNSPLHADGKITFKRGVTDSTVHLGFFHNTGSVVVSEAQAISTPENFIGVTVEGPSSEGFYFYPSYGSAVEGSGSGGNRGILTPPHIYPDSTTHNWTLDYDPLGNGGTGQIVITLDGVQGIMNLDPTHCALGASFNLWVHHAAHRRQWSDGLRR